MRIVITGATGNVGSALLRRLTTTKDHSLIGLARRLPELGEDDQVTWHSLDLTEDSPEVLRYAFLGADAVVHLAWAFQPSHDQAYLEALGVGGTRRVLEAIRSARVPHLVHMSSIGAYSPKQDGNPVDESWPTDGVPTSPYSRNKAAAERLLDAFEQAEPRTLVSRVRPGIVGQRAAGSALLRNGVPVLVPARAIGLVPVVPLDQRLAIPIVHADDVADAIERILLRKAKGAFNLAAEPPITTDRIAAALGAKAVHVPAAIVRAAMSAGWHARLQQVDPGWLDLAFAVPLLDTSRAGRELDWSPTVDATAVLSETLTGMRDAAADRTAVLRPRTVLGQFEELIRGGPISHRRRP